MWWHSQNPIPIIPPRETQTLISSLSSKSLYFPETPQPIQSPRSFDCHHRHRYCCCRGSEATEAPPYGSPYFCLLSSVFLLCRSCCCVVVVIAPVFLSLVILVGVPSLADLLLLVDALLPSMLAAVH